MPAVLRPVTIEEVDALESQVIEILRHVDGFAGDLKELIAESKGSKDLLREKLDSIRIVVNRHSRLLDGDGDGLATRLAQVETWMRGTEARLAGGEKAGRSERKMVYGMFSAVLVALISAAVNIYQSTSTPAPIPPHPHPPLIRTVP